MGAFPGAFFGAIPGNFFILQVFFSRSKDWMLCLRFNNLIYYYHSKKSIRIKMIKNYKKG